MNYLKEIKYKEKRSEFIGLLFSCDEIKKSSEIISTLKKIHPQANHILACGHYKTCDVIKEDGEPIKSMHILCKIFNNEEIFDYLICIVRYYGGVKLGQKRLSKVYCEIGKKLIEFIKEKKS